MREGGRTGDSGRDLAFGIFVVEGGKADGGDADRVVVKMVGGWMIWYGYLCLCFGAWESRVGGWWCFFFLPRVQSLWMCRCGARCDVMSGEVPDDVFGGTWAF